MQITARIENAYLDEVVTREVTVTVPSPSGDDLSVWAEDALWPLTGTGRSGPATYYVTILEAAERPELVGRVFEWA